MAQLTQWIVCSMYYFFPTLCLIILVFDWPNSLGRNLFFLPIHVNMRHHQFYFMTNILLNECIRRTVGDTNMVPCNCIICVCDYSYPLNSSTSGSIGILDSIDVRSKRVLLCKRRTLLMVLPFGALSADCYVSFSSKNLRRNTRRPQKPGLWI